MMKTKQQAIKASNMIDRQAAITIPVMPIEHRKYQTFNLDDAYEQGWIDCQDCIKELPSEEPKQKKGEWIDYSGDGYVECPFCHSATNCEGNKYELHYCFSCGADMRGDDRNEI